MYVSRLAMGRPPRRTHRRKVLDFAQITAGQVAEGLVGRAVGQDEHIARLARLLGQFLHAVDKRHHHGQQGDHGGEGQRGHQSCLPAHGQVSEVVAQRNLADDEQAQKYDGGCGEQFEDHQATFEKTSATRTFRADQAGKKLPANEAAPPMAGPHQSAAMGTKNRSKNPIGNVIPPMPQLISV